MQFPSVSSLVSPYKALRFYGQQVQGATVGGITEAVGGVGQWGEGDGRDLLGCGAGDELVQLAVGGGYVDQRAVDGDVGGEGSSTSAERNGGDGAGVEAVKKDSLIAGHDVKLTVIRREEKIDGIESSMVDVDVSGREGAGRIGRHTLGDDDILGTKCTES